MKGYVALFIAIVLGLVAVLGVRSFMQKQQLKVEQTLKPVRILVAAKRIEPGTRITVKMITEAEVPEAQVSDDNILPGASAAVYGAVAARPIDRDQAIAWSNLVRERPKLTTQLPAGMVALTLPVDNVSGVAFNIRPDSRIDIIGTFTLVRKGSSTAIAVTRRLLTNVQVLAVDNRTSTELEAVGAPGYQSRYSTVTLAVTPEESVILTYARLQGTLTLDIRNTTDEISAEPSEITQDNILTAAQQANETRRKMTQSTGPLTGVSGATP